MQDQSNDLVNVYSRLDRLRKARGMTWKELAADLRISYTMVYFIKTGRRSLGVKALHRLREAEIFAGLRPVGKPAAATDTEEKDRAFSYEMMLELKKRWERRPAERDEIAVALRLLFRSKGTEILDWLKRK